jgi:ribosomal protein L37E
LVDNALDSLDHAAKHLVVGDREVSVNDLKRAVLDVTHAVELLIKERLRREHPAFVWDRVDDFPTSGREFRSVSAETAVKRLERLAGAHLTDDERDAIERARRLRNQIQHFEFELGLPQTKVIVGSLLSFVFGFSRRELEDVYPSVMDVASDLRKFQEFWNRQAPACEKELQHAGHELIECNLCGALTFLVVEAECRLCGHHDEPVRCDYCGKWTMEEFVERTDEGDVICMPCTDAMGPVLRDAYMAYGLHGLLPVLQAELERRRRKGSRDRATPDTED